MAKRVTMTFSDGGVAKIEVAGVTGPACEAITKGVEQALGGEVLSHQRTREFDKEETEVEQQKARA